jgi:hypothetical protein
VIILKIVTTPMTAKILELAGVKDFKISKNPDEEDGDLAILISEHTTKMNSFVIKLNTFRQIRKSIIDVFYRLYQDLDNLHGLDINENIENYFKDSKIANKWLNKSKTRDLHVNNANINVMVYTNFLRDIVGDMGYNIINREPSDNISPYKSLKEDLVRLNNEKNLNFKFIIIPDIYDIDQSILNQNITDKIIQIPSHWNVSNDPLKRAEARYKLLEELVK